ncbi:MAG: FHIPEP family type III secretion protein, partial [Planctomycetota bacterium]
MAFICDIHTVTSDAAKPDQKAQRPCLAYISIGLAVLAGLFLPLPIKVIDVLVILSLSLTAAVILIALSAKTTSEMSGFDHLIRATTILRSFLFAICCRLILTEAYAGVIVGFLNRTIKPDNMIVAILILPLLAGFIFIFICKASTHVSRTAKDFICNIVSKKHLQVEKELGKHLIDQNQAQELHSIIKHENGLFVTLEEASKYMFYDAIIGFIFILLCFIGGMVIAMVSRTTSAISTNTYIYLTYGTVTTIQIPALVIALAFRFLVKKNYDEFGKIVKSKDTLTRRINVMSREIDKTKMMKRQLEERVVMRSVINSESAIEQKKPENYKQLQIFSEDIPITEELEWVDEQKSTTEQKNAKLWAFEEIKDNYDDVAELIKAKCEGKLKTILMGAESPKILPVTVPVNTAIKLAKEGRKCLLIDLDYQRDSIAKVFEVHKNILDENIPSGQTITGIPTCVRNMWLYPACWLTEKSKDTTKLDCLKINQIITHLKITYDHLIVYSPDLNKHHGCKLIGECIDGAMLFGNDSTNLA